MRSGDIGVTPWKPLWWRDSGFCQYRIWQRVWYESGRWQQMHEWRRHDGTTKADGWINSLPYWAGEVSLTDEKPPL